MVKLLDWEVDQNDIWLMRLVIVLFTAITVGTILYNYLIPYGPHDEIVKLCLVLGAIPGIVFLKVIHTLRTRREEHYV